MDLLPSFSRRSVVVIAFLVALVVAVDKSNFKKCQDSSFCRFHRNREFQSSFKALPNSITIKKDLISGLIRNNNNEDDLLKFELHFYEDKTIRLKVNEAAPLRVRYEIPDGDVIQSLRHQSLQVKEADDNHVALTSMESLALVLHYDPFSVDIYVSDRPVMSINSRQLMYIIRHKRATKKSSSWFSWVSQLFFADEEGDSTEDWTETFNSHKDTRPYGPSSLGLDVAFVNFSHVYGIPEHAHNNLALKSTKNAEPYRLYNLDVFEYELDNNMALYGSVPVMIAHNVDTTVGMFWNNPSETWVDVLHALGKVDTHWISECGVMDAFFVVGPQPRDVFRQFARITGSTPLPPLFSIAYHQSRWNYVDENDVFNVVNGFDENEIPMDVLWLDIEHTHSKRYFTFDSNKFPNPKRMLEKVAKTKRRMVTAVDPHLKKDSSHYKVYSSASRAGHLVKDKNGNEFEGWCWPGSSAWLDFIDPGVRKFWAEQFKYSNYEGSTDHLFTWNDMNEPAVFNGPEVTMHKDNIHYEGREHREIHNVYGLYVHRSSFEGQLLRSGGTARPFVLSRSFFAGSQKYGAVWTGDNAADWDHLEVTLPMLMTLNLVGVTFSGADVGGFFRNPSVELLTRWYQAAAYQPFFRAHAHLDTKRREPWLFKKEEMELITEAIKKRYALLPYWYLLFFRSETSGEPIMKPLWTEFPEELETFEIHNEHLLGDSILVRPVTKMGVMEVDLYLPGCGEVWFDFNYKPYNGCSLLNHPVTMESVPVFYRGGKIIPIRERIRRSSLSSPDDPYSLLVYLDKQSGSQGELYHDDFLSYKYREGLYVHRNFSYSGGILLSRSLNSASQEFHTTSWLERIYIIGINSRPSEITLSSEGDTKRLEGRYDDEKNLLVVRKPAVNIDRDFELRIKF